MVFLLVAFAVLVVFSILLFSSKTFSPIPYFPSNKKDMSLITETLGLKNNQTVIDLGAGDGIVIFEAAKSAMAKGLDTRFVAVEINPVLILVLHVKRLFQPNKKNIKIIRDDIFKMDFHTVCPAPQRSTPYTLTAYLYISPWHMEKVIKNLKLKIKNFEVVSYMYPIKKILRKQMETKGINSVFKYCQTSL